MTIGTPYNFTETNIKNKSVMLADFIAAKENIPSTLHVYSVAGTITYDSDELVPDASVSAGKYIYQNQAKSYTEITVTGEDAQHSDLPTNDEVVDLVKQHIEGQGIRKKQKTKSGASVSRIRWWSVLVSHYQKSQSDRVFDGSIFFGR